MKRVKLWGVNQLYVVGGNGGNAAANAIQKECEAQAVLCSVVGIPKSIDNDILLVVPLLRISSSSLVVRNTCHARYEDYMLQNAAVQVSRSDPTLSRHAKYEDDMLQSPAVCNTTFTSHT